MRRVCAWVAVVAFLGVVVPAEAAVPPSTSGGAYTVRFGVDGVSPSGGQPWEGVSRAGGRLRGGSDGFGAYFVVGNTGADPQFGDRQGWTMALPPGVRLSTFSIDVSTGSWVARRWTSGLRYTLAATDADGAVLGAPFLTCEPTEAANDCPGAFKSDAGRVFSAPPGARRIELMVECVLASGCSRFANPDGGPGGNEYALVEGGTFNLVDDRAPALGSGFGDLWKDPERWFHNSDRAAAGMAAADNAGVSRLQWYVDGSLAYDTGGVTTAFSLPCSYAFLEPCPHDTAASFALGASLFTIPDGLHELTVVAVDEAGNVSPPLTRRFRLDDSAPPRVGVVLREGPALRDPGPWHLDFTAPPELDGAPLQSASYRFCAASNPDDCTAAESVREGIDGLAPGEPGVVAVSPPSPGEWTVRLWLADRAGNSSEANASSPVLIRFGQSAPVADPAHPPTLSGDFADGARVRVSASGFDVAGAVEYAFQWQRCSGADGDGGCVDVAGATAQEYVLVHADAGRRMRARVTASNAKGSDSAVSAVSAPVAFLPPAHGRASLVGVMRAGETLRVAGVAFDGTPPFELTYAWLRCSSGACDPIAGADSASYVLGDEDVGQTIRSSVTATNPAGSSSAEAARFGEEETVAPAAPRSVSAPDAPAGALVVGQTLSASDGSWVGSRPMTFSYAWQRCSGISGACVAIPDATGSSYVLAGEDVGRTIRVLVTARNGGDPVGPVASARTTPVEPAPAQPAAPPPVDSPPAVAPPEPPAALPEPTAALPEPTAALPEPTVIAPAAGSPAADLGKIPGNLVGAATCKVVRATPKKRSARVRGVGPVTFAAAVPQRVTAADPLLLTVRAGTHRLRSVSYRIGRRTVGRSKRAPYRAAVKPRSLQAFGTQVLTAFVTPRKKGARPGRITMRLNVAECPSLLTAGVRFTGARAVTQLRVFSRTSIRAGTLTLPARLVPEVKAGKAAGKLTLVGLGAKPAATRLIAARGGRLLAGRGLAIHRSGRTVTFSGIPTGTGIVQLDLFGPRRVALRLLHARKPLRFSATVRADAIPTQRLLATIGTRT